MNPTDAVRAKAQDRAESPLFLNIQNNQQGICDAYVVYVDVVSYSKRKGANQLVAIIHALQDRFSLALMATAREYQSDLSALSADLLRDVIIIPLGDGMAVAFPFPNLFELPLYFAKRLFEEVERQNQYPQCSDFTKDHWCGCHNNMTLRCGIAYGPAKVFTDVNNRLNLAGKAMNAASRLQVVANPRQIFVNDDYFKRFDLLGGAESLFRSYEVKVKHEDTLPAYQFCGPHVGVDPTARLDLDRHPTPVHPTDNPDPRPRMTAATQEAVNTVASAMPAGPEYVTDLERRMITVPAGEFVMGDSTDNRFTVGLTHPFRVDPYPVTRGFYRAVMNRNSSLAADDDLPVDRVSWYDAVDFCIALSLQAHRIPVYTRNGRDVSADFRQTGFRLPTEAEWEYCALRDEEQFGTAPIEQIAWCSANTKSGPLPVGQMRRQASPLADILGNVWEWCWDFYAPYPKAPQVDYQGGRSGIDRIIRGGCWLDPASTIGSRQRHRKNPAVSELAIGFRVVRHQ